MKHILDSKIHFITFHFHFSPMSQFVVGATYKRMEKFSIKTGIVSILLKVKVVDWTFILMKFDDFIFTTQPVHCALLMTCLIKVDTKAYPSERGGLTLDKVTSSSHGFYLDKTNRIHTTTNIDANMQTPHRTILLRGNSAHKERKLICVTSVTIIQNFYTC